ncbi:hypothetical protein NLO95_12940 [Pseudomonas syringae]|nr:hypothetical protein [Pseudomonas syringae]
MINNNPKKYQNQSSGFQTQDHASLRDTKMRVDAALRLLAVPLCGALVYAAVMPLLKGLSATSLFTGLLYGFIVSMVVGVPLLLVGDRFFPGSKARHIVSSLLQSLLLYLSKSRSDHDKKH